MRNNVTDCPLRVFWFLKIRQLSRRTAETREERFCNLSRGYAIRTDNALTSGMTAPTCSDVFILEKIRLK